VIQIEGEGNTETLDPPRPEHPGLHVQGMIVRREPGACTATFDLVPLRSDLVDIPSVSFAFFDPQLPGRYRMIETQPISLRVRPGAGGAGSASDPVTVAVAGVDDIYGLMPVSGGAADSGLSVAVIVLVIAGPWVMAAVLLVRMRSRERDRSHPEEARARAAARAFRANAVAEGSDVAAALTEYLAARLGCGLPAVITPDLALRLRRARIDAGLAQRSASLLERLVAAGYGGRRSPDDSSAACALVDELEKSFMRADR